MARDDSAGEVVMQIRAMRPSDIPKLESLYARARAKYDIPLLDTKMIVAAPVLVDDNDEPRMMLAAEQVAEIFLVMDHEWETPNVRMVGLTMLGKEIRRRLEDKGFRAAYAFLGPDIPTGYDRKLCAKLHARRMVRRCLKWIRGEG